MVGELTINQRENLQKFTTPNNNINRCFFEKLQRGGEEGGAYGQGQKTGGALTSREKKDYINVLKLRAVKYTILTFFSFACQRSINMHSNGQYRCHFIFGENGRYSKQLSDCLEQKNMGLFVDPRVHKRISPRVTQSGGRYSVQDSKWSKQMGVKSQFISEDLQIQGNTGDGYFFESHINYLKRNSVRPSNTNSSNPSMADTVLVPSVSEQMSIKNPLLLSSISNLLIGPNKKNNQLIENKNCNSWNGQFQGNVICRRIIRKVCHLYCKCQKTMDSLSLRISLA